eukprot:CAMPEP_0204481066 /NCGR_PEP_ID=MMETSP0471-20130131/45735_1 /ASSEMBLY_ACC=CAM_ASM_000602 /TAXON_ID=2969 /ORGANISM="Oxyrrhis marina" /LENGTH=314 /DNA_ID=CAMNT_0051484179 /DNA_START=114 /DNA_END=1055 /DNA_ORIENTATION=-
MVMLVQCRDKISPVNEVDYEEVGGAALGQLGRRLVQAATLAFQFGVCVVQITFVATNFAAAFDMPVRDSILVVLPMFVAVASIQSIKVLSTLALPGNGLLSVGLLVVLCSVPPNQAAFEDAVERGWTGTTASAVSAVGNLVYASEGIAVVLPMRNSAEAPGDFMNVLKVTLSCVTCMFTAFGGLCFVGLHGIVNSASASAALAGHVSKGQLLLANFLLSGAVLVGFPLQALPVARLYKGELLQQWHVQVLVVFVAALVAVAVPEVDILVDIVGNSAGVVLGFVLPIAFHYILCAPSRRRALLLHVPVAVIATFA